MWPAFKPKLEKNCSEKISHIFSKKAFHIFQEKELSYILENETSYFRREIPGLKNEKKKTLSNCFLYFGKWDLLALGLKNLYFRRNFQSPKNQNLLHFFKKRYE